MPDPVTAALGAGTVPAAPTPAPTADFAALLDAHQADPATLETVTLGEMLSGPQPVAAVGAPAVAPSTVGGVAAAGRSTGMMRWPVRGRTTSEFGPRTHPVTGSRRDHDGLDIAAPTGTPIVAADGGRVTFAGQQGGYGNVVVIDHGGGVETRYAHQSSLAVSVGDRVRQGQRIGAVGSTGLSTGPHLHFEVRRGGTPVDPRSRLGG